ncbi:MAG TPA: prepilin-type N-terminal cleavage/methylation domain-containing protein [Patescibacteria group bacterium]
MKIFRANSKGFTLVELLIVIALIAILSVAVLATINPIEQTNKARDAKFRNDTAEVLSAYERYYAAQNAYPWNTNTSGVGTSVKVDAVVGLNGTDPGFGVYDKNVAAGFTGALIATSELKSSFQGKEPFASAQVPEIDMMYTYHSAAGNNYVCYHPKANANRTGTIATQLKCMSGIGSGVTLSDLNKNGCLAETNWATLAIGAARANLICVPEGDVQ